MENEKKDKAMMMYEALNEETCIMLTLSRMSEKNLRLVVCGDEAYGIYLRDEAKDAVMRTARAYTQERIFALNKELEKLMNEDEQ